MSEELSGPDPAFVPAASDRFWAKVQQGTPEECWRWRAALDGDGYGRFYFGGRRVMAHRMSVVLDGRPIGRGLVVDHICRTRDCVNPGHLRIVTPFQNLHENSMAPSHLASISDTCHAGHKFDEGNTRRNVSGHRLCRACERVRDRKRYHDQKSEGLRKGRVWEPFTRKMARAHG